jgi:hypothetical protein
VLKREVITDALNLNLKSAMRYIMPWYRRIFW